MTEYLPAQDNFTDYKQTVEYTLQFKQYIGKFTVTIGGNTRGRSILNYWDFENCWLTDDADNADFSFDEDEDSITIVLKDPATGETCTIEDEPREFNKYIVKAEIIDAVKQ